MNIAKNPDFVSILSVTVNTLKMSDACEFIDKAITINLNTYICCIPLHSIMECQQNPNLIPIFNNSYLNTPDGMGVVFLLRLFGHKNVERVYGPDLLAEICKISPDIGYKHYFLGSTETVLETQD